MHYCDDCRREFKSVQGLLGHQRMMHNAGQNKSERSASIEGTDTVQRHQHQAGGEGAMEIAEGLERIAILEQQRVNDARRYELRIKVSRKEGIKTAAAYYENIDGVTELREKEQDSRISDIVHDMANSLNRRHF